ncbi:MAG: hypothetical protein F6K42_31930 [Leptolyngbya sp. SIO1D8]|nr:hypothetical protein [Leptolyngbya sp. SIO1D8]
MVFSPADLFIDQLYLLNMLTPDSTDGKRLWDIFGVYPWEFTLNYDGDRNRTIEGRQPMRSDIRNLGHPLRHWHSSPSHPGFGYCFCTTGTDASLRIHIASKRDFQVTGTFASFQTAEATMQKLYQLEAQAA